MAKINNDSKGGTSGHAQMDPVAVPPGPVYSNPGARSLSDADWVKRDMQYKTSVPQQKFY